VRDSDRLVAQENLVQNQFTGRFVEGEWPCQVFCRGLIGNRFESFASF
jgi:hypothetical protein